MARRNRGNRNINVGRSGTFGGMGGGRGVSQCAFAITSGTKEYTIQLFPSDGKSVFSLFPGLAPGMVVRLTGMQIQVASANQPGAVQWYDMNFSATTCMLTKGNGPTEIKSDDMTLVEAGGDGTRNSPCTTIGALGQTTIRVPMATNAQFVSLLGTWTTKNSEGVVDGARGNVLGSLVTTGFAGFCTITINYQVGPPRMLGIYGTNLGRPANFVEDTTDSH